MRPAKTASLPGKMLAHSATAVRSERHEEGAQREHAWKFSSGEPVAGQSMASRMAVFHAPATAFFLVLCILTCLPMQAQQWRVAPTILDAFGDTCEYLDCYAEVANLASDSATLRIQVISVDIPTGWMASICVFNCFPPEADQIVQTFGPNEDTLVHIMWTTSNIPAKGSITCRFSDTATGTVLCTYTFTASTLRTGLEHAIGTVPTCVLSGHYPNPLSLSSPSANVIFRYATSNSGHVTLNIIDLYGHLVATVLDEFQVAGTHRAIWNGRDTRNRRLPPGMYVYRLCADGARAARRLLITR